MNSKDIYLKYCQMFTEIHDKFIEQGGTEEEFKNIVGNIIQNYSTIFWEHYLEHDSIIPQVINEKGGKVGCG